MVIFSYEYGSQETLLPTVYRLVRQRLQARWFSARLLATRATPALAVINRQGGDSRADLQKAHIGC